MEKKQIPIPKNGIVIDLTERRIEPVDCDIIMRVYNMLYNTPPPTRLPQNHFHFSPKMLPTVMVAIDTNNGIELFSYSRYNVGKWNIKYGYWHPVLHMKLLSVLSEYKNKCFE